MADSRKNGLAIFSLILGILALLLFGFFAAIPGIITGHMARSRVKRDPSVYGGEGIALAGLILSYLALIASIFLVWYVTSNPEFMDSIINMQQGGLGTIAPSPAQ